MTLNYGHIASVRGMTAEELHELATPVVDALRNLPTITPGYTDAAGIPIRGASVYMDALDNRFNARQIAAARCVLFGGNARITVIDSLEFAIIAD